MQKKEQQIAVIVCQKKVKVQYGANKCTRDAPELMVVHACMQWHQPQQQQQQLIFPT